MVVIVGERLSPKNVMSTDRYVPNESLRRSRRGRCCDLLPFRRASNLFLYLPSRFLSYLAWKLDAVVRRGYVAVLLHGGGSPRPSLSWAKRAYRVLSRPYKKNLLMLLVVRWTKGRGCMH